MLTNTNIKPPGDTNLEEFLKCKTYIWNLYIENKKSSNFNNFSISIDSYSDIEIIEHLINSKERKLVLKHNNKFFVYKIFYETYLKNKDYKQKQNKNNYTYEKDKDSLIYPSIIYIVDRCESFDPDVILSIHLKIAINHVLFNTEVITTSIKLITKKDYMFIKQICKSSYEDNPVSLQNKTINKQEFVFKIFYHPHLCPLDNIYGIEYTSVNYLSVYNIDYRFCVSSSQKK